MNLYLILFYYFGLRGLPTTYLPAITFKFSGGDDGFRVSGGDDGYVIGGGD